MRPSSRKFFIVLVLALGLVMLLTGIMAAEGELISRFILSNGGGRIVSEDVALQSVIGQPAAGRVSNGTIILCSGFQCAPGIQVVAETPTETPVSTSTPTATPTTITPERTTYLPHVSNEQAQP